METLADLLEEAKRRAVLVLIYVVVLAYAMSLTSSSVWFNIPVAILFVAVLRHASFHLELRWKPTPGVREQHHRQLPSGNFNWIGPSTSSSLARWKKKIDSPLVEAAMDELICRLIHEWVVDLWYRSITPDEDAPHELRALINDALGEISLRARKVNLINLLTRDVVNIVINHLELFRQMKIQVGEEVLGTLSSEGKDEKLKAALASAKKLHPAVISSETELQVLQRLMDGVVAAILKPQDAQCRLLRNLARELLACAVMRPIMNFASPGFINQLIELLSKTEDNKTSKLPKSGPNDKSSRNQEKLFMSKEPSSPGLEMVAVGMDLPSEGSHDIERKTSGVPSTKRPFSNDDRGIQPRIQHSDENIGKPLVVTKRHVIRQSGQTVSGDWAHVLDVVSHRKTQVLAPENLDNLWAKGRNYKRKEARKGLSRSAELEPLTVSQVDHMLRLPLADQSTSKSDAAMTKGSKGLAQRGPLVAGSLYDKQELSNSKISLHDGVHESIKPDLPDVEILDARGSKSVVGSRVIHHPLEDPNSHQSSDTDDKPHQVFQVPRRTRSSSGLDDWKEVENKTYAVEGSNAHLKMVSASGNLEYTQNNLLAPSQSCPRRENIVQQATTSRKLKCQVKGAHCEKNGSKAFVVYSIEVSDAEDKIWMVDRRFRNFEQLHRRLRDMPHYNLSLPPKRFLGSSLDNTFVQERCKLLDKYLKDLLSIPSIAELHEVCDFLSTKSKNYSFGGSSVIKTLAVNMDDAVDDMFRQFKGVTDDIQGVFKTAKRQVGTSASTSGSMHLDIDSSISYLRHLSDDEADGSTRCHETTKDYGQSGWHSDSEVHEERARGRSTRTPVKSGEFVAVDESYRYTKRSLEAASSDGPSPPGSLEGSDLFEEEMDVPREWTPPKLTVPLLNLVEVIFQLDRRGFIRRQVLWMAKTILQLGIGDAVDDWLLNKIRWLRREDVVASGINWIQEVLWPDGVFITKQSNDVEQSSFEDRLESSRRAAVVREIIYERAPVAIVSLIGHKQYHRCAKDIYEFIQSAVFTKQLAYGLLEKLLQTAFPELQGLIREIHLSNV